MLKPEDLYANIVILDSWCRSAGIRLSVTTVPPASGIASKLGQQVGHMFSCFDQMLEDR